jgi:hypothetical protein
MESIKTYKAILLAVGGIVIVVGGAYWYMSDMPAKEEAIVKTQTRTIEGQVTRMFEGENKVVYSFDVPETATSTTGMEDALVKVTNNDLPYTSMYFSYEGGRGYAAEDYIKNVIAPRVPVLTIIGTTTIGSRVWTVAESTASEWHVAQVGDGQWLLIVENKKALHDQVAATLESLRAE